MGGGWRRGYFFLCFLHFFLDRGGFFFLHFVLTPWTPARLDAGGP